MSRTKTVRSLVLAILALVVLAMPTVVLADGRVALVVGNGGDPHGERRQLPARSSACRTTRKPFAGTAAPPSRDTPTGRPERKKE